MLKFVMVAAFALIFAVGCGVKQQYVQDEIAASEARTNAKISEAEQQAQANAAEITKLQALAKELDGKAEMALNKAKGFENYQIIWTGEVHFSFDSWAVDEVAKTVLDEAGTKMEQNPGALMEIVGHTDRTGSSSYNYLLGDKRASATQRYLSDNFGISLYRMFLLSYGEDKPVAMPDENSSASKNRRVQLTIWGEM